MPGKQFRVYVFPDADQKLARHMAFLANVSQSAAIQLLHEYEQSLTYLEINPRSCTPYSPRNPVEGELRQKLFGERYRIVFEILKSDVYIYDIQDCRQHDDKNLL